MSFHKSTLKELLHTWKQSRKYGRGRYSFHKYLVAVYNRYAELRKTKGLANKTRDKIVKWTKGKTISKKTHALAVIIIASSREDPRTQSRWAQALRYAWKWRKERAHLTLTKFFEKNGGVAGCRSKWSNKQKPKL
jgi:Tfp pilus assembly major pilin PilA